MPTNLVPTQANHWPVSMIIERARQMKVAKAKSYTISGHLRGEMQHLVSSEDATMGPFAASA
jgi:hypothetical protein